jgi:hypothetical protein
LIEEAEAKAPEKLKKKEKEMKKAEEVFKLWKK